MADRVIKVIDPSQTYDLISLEELKIAFGIHSADTSQDELLSMLITTYSDVIATMCNRVFAYETVREIWRCVDHDHTNAMTRLFMSHYPIDPAVPILLESPTGSELDPAIYEIEERSGKIELLSTNTEPITVTYAGGYLLPDDAPPALKQALMLMIREGQAMMQRLAVSGIRSISHKDSRVMYYDATQQLAKGPAGASGLINAVANNLLTHYIRVEV